MYRMGFFVLLAGAVVAFAAPADPGPNDPERSHLVEVLTHLEGLASSASAEYEFQYGTTPPESVPLIQEACRLSGDENYDAYVISDGFVKANNKTVTWLRSGPKEKVIERSGRGVTTKVFDGHVVKGLTAQKDGSIGSVDTVESGHWTSVDRQHPFTFIYEDRGTRYSSLLRDAEELTISRESRGGRDCLKVAFKSRPGDWLSFELVFDNQLRLIEKSTFGKLPSEPKPRLYTRVLFTDFRAHKQTSGETIWLPHKAVYHNHVGELADGTPVEYSADTVIVHKIAFNVDIPDKEFILDFPPGTKIWDGVGGLGWLDKSEMVQELLDRGLAAVDTVESTTQLGVDENVRPASPVAVEAPVATPAPGAAARRSGWVVIWVALAACAVLAVVGTLYLQRRRRRAGVGK